MSKILHRHQPCVVAEQAFIERCQKIVRQVATVGRSQNSVILMTPDSNARTLFEEIGLPETMLQGLTALSRLQETC